MNESISKYCDSLIGNYIIVFCGLIISFFIIMFIRRYNNEKRRERRERGFGNQNH